MTPNIKNILSLIVYTCFLAVHITATPLINENIHLKNDLRIFKKLDNSVYKSSLVIKLEKNLFKIKKGNLNRRFHPEYFEFYHALNSNSNFSYTNTKKYIPKRTPAHHQLNFKLACRPPPYNI